MTIRVLTSEDMVVDPLRKGINAELFFKHVSLMGLRDTYIVKLCKVNHEQYIREKHEKCHYKFLCSQRTKPQFSGRKTFVTNKLIVND